MDMKQISSLLTAVALLLLCGGCDFRTTREKAEQGDAKAQYNLGWMYYKGEGVPQDDAEAAKWFRKAAVQGNDRAQFGLGVMYDEGQGVPQDDAEALKWYRKAAEQGNADAQNNLGVSYARGEGVPKNFIEAYAWFLLAKANEYEGASKGISDLEKHLTAEQMEKGQARAAELHRLYGAE